MQKRRILYIEANRDGTIGGSYYSLLYLVEGLNKKLYEPIVMFYEPNPLIIKFQRAGAQVTVFDHSSPSTGNICGLEDFFMYIPGLIRDILIVQPKLSRILEKIKPDIVHLNNSYAVCHDWVLACKRKGLKVIAHDRGTRPPVSLQTRFFCRYLDAIICVSDAFLENVTNQQLRPTFACSVYNGLNVEKFSSAASRFSSDKIRKKFGVTPKDILVGMVGNIDYWKGQLVFVNAIKIILKRFPNIKGLLVGKTVRGAEKYESEIRSFISQNELDSHIVLTGYRDDVPALLNALDIFVHASIEPEPFGRVILEAMAMKKPIVATGSGGPRELIVHGESGLLVPMKDHHAMAEALRRYLLDMKKAKEMGVKARERLERNFSIRNMVSGIEAVYQRVLKD